MNIFSATMEQDRIPFTTDPLILPMEMELDLPKVKAELLRKFAECQQRGLMHTAKWLAEILHALRYDKLPIPNITVQLSIFTRASVVSTVFEMIASQLISMQWVV